MFAFSWNLYIDDDDAAALTMRRLLERRGYIVSPFTDPREAIDMLRLDPSAFDLVMSDYNMPHLSGLDVASAIRDVRTDLPVGRNIRLHRRNLLFLAKAAGVRELIVKPIKTMELYAVLERLWRSPR